MHRPSACAPPPRPGVIRGAAAARHCLPWGVPRRAPTFQAGRRTCQRSTITCSRRSTARTRRVRAHAAHAGEDDGSGAGLDGPARPRATSVRRSVKTNPRTRSRTSRPSPPRPRCWPRSSTRSAREARQPPRRGHAAQHPRRGPAGENHYELLTSRRSAASRRRPRSTSPTRCSPRPRRCSPRSPSATRCSSTPTCSRTPCSRARAT